MSQSENYLKAIIWSGPVERSCNDLEGSFLLAFADLMFLHIGLCQRSYVDLCYDGDFWDPRLPRLL